MRSSPLEATPPEADERQVQSWLLLGTTYATIVSGALLLAVAEHTIGYALMAAVFCAGHCLVVGPRGPSYLPASLSKLLAIGALAYGLLQARHASVHISYGLAHFLILVQLIMLYGPHTVRDLRLIQVAAIFVALVASIWALDLIYLPAFLLAALSLMSSLVALSMFPPVPAAQEAAFPREPASAQWRHLLSALWLPAVAAFGFTAVLFVVLPRIHSARDPYGALAQQTVGFSENVSLHEVGRLRQSDEMVMRVEFLPADEPRATPLKRSRVLMRGLSLPVYGDGQWVSPSAVQWGPQPGPSPEEDEQHTNFTSRSVYQLSDVPVAAQRIRQKVFVELKPLRNIFALYRPLSVEGINGGLRPVSALEHHLVLPRLLRPGESYEVISLVPQFAPHDLRRVGTPRPDRQSWFFWYVPREIRGTIRRVADEIMALYPASTDYDRVMSAQRYLLESGLFRYTYDLPEFGLGDPIEAFLTRTRQGSCEQFSTALALILRAWGIPTRLAIGFKDGEYDPVSQAYSFREKHAHAWVEVYFNERGWVEFDPTPGAELAAPPSRGMAGRLRGLLDRLQGAAVRLYRKTRAEWAGSVIGYNRTKQKRVLEGFSKAASSLASRASGIVGALWPGMPGRGTLQVAMLVVLLTLAGMALYMAARWLQGKATWPGVPGRARRTLWFYQDMLRVLRRKGVVRPPHFTPREFAQRAATQLAQTNRDVSSLRQALELVTDLYYRVRFGGCEPTATEIGAVRAALSALRRAQRARRSGGEQWNAPKAEPS